jgi:hypothetical protein
MSNDILFQDLVGGNTYWNSKGKYQAIYETKYESLVPPAGICETEEGEMLRASAKLYYDYYNNGMCNNTSGPAKFLMIMDEKYGWGLTNELHKIYSNSNNEGYGEVNLELELEAVVDKVLEHINVNADTPNTQDMWDCGDEDVTFEDEYDYEDDWDEDED